MCIYLRVIIPTNVYIMTPSHHYQPSSRLCNANMISITFILCLRNFANTREARLLNPAYVLIMKYLRACRISVSFLNNTKYHTRVYSRIEVLLSMFWCEKHLLNIKHNYIAHRFCITHTHTNLALRLLKCR